MATTKFAIAPMKAVQIPKAGADFQIVEREIPTPGAGQVRIKVQACGVCHSDMFTKDGVWPGIQYPRGRKASALVSAGTAATTALVPRAGAEIFAIAGILKFRASAMTADTSSTWWLPWRPWRRYRKV
jgi:NADPH:quinone reductase-like Zn-dependent oxidoreductase